MTSFMARLLLALLTLWGLALAPAQAQPAPVVLLTPGTPSFMVTGPVPTWLESGASATIAEVAQRPQNFHNAPALHREALSNASTLWLHLRVRRAPGDTQGWTLNIPLPFVDEVQLFQRDAQGQWQRQLAGDTIAQGQWSLRSLYPDFQLEIPTGEEHDLYLRIRNFKHLSLPLRLATVSERQFERLAEFIGLGMLLGAMAVLMLLSVIRYIEHHTRSDIAAAGYSALVLASVAQVNGVLNLLLWTQLPQIGNIAYSVLPVLAIGASLLFVRMLYAISTHHVRYDRLLVGMGALTLASSLVYLYDRSVADRVGAAVLMAAATTGLIATFLSWRGHSRIWYWLMAAYLPQYLCLLRMMVEAMGLVPIWWELRYVLSVSIALSVPILMHALARATHDRKELQVRARHLPTQDALTGLLTRQAFMAELQTAYDRVLDNREPVAVVVVRVVNYEHIRKGLGDTVAENSLLRAVIKLHRILRDVDPAGRVAAGQFGLILDGVMARQTLTERMVQLIGSGLIPLPGLHPPVTLQFQAACVLLHENPLPPDETLDGLQELLASMSHHTRRPIRFLEPLQTQPAPLAGSTLP